MQTVPTPGGRKTAVFTIVSKNYLHFARVLMDSIADVSPDVDRFVVLADRVDGAFHPDNERFVLVQAEDLSLPDQQQFFFRYTILELNTAVKPWFFRRLFDQGYESVIYLDPDIYVYRPLREVWAILAEGALAVLVPHLTGRLRDDFRPGELDILRSGTYNLGFCALGRHPSLDDLLDFWCEKSVRQFVADPAHGLFTDQRWMDLVPGMFPDVRILRHEGYDVAYWNLPHRRVEATSDGTSVNGQPLVFFHYSGIDPGNPKAFSKHQNRYLLSELGPTRDLVSGYCARLVNAGLVECSAWPYAYGSFSDGAPVHDLFRKLYRSVSEVEDWAGSDPFARSSRDWNAPVDEAWPPVSRAMLALYQARSDLRRIWPSMMNDDTQRTAFVQWFMENGELSGIAACYVAPIREAMVRTAANEGPHTVGTRRDMVVSVQGFTGALRKAVVAVREGRLPLSPQKWIQLYRLHMLEASQREAEALGPLPAIEWPERRTMPGPYRGFFPQSPGERVEGVAWMSASGSVTLPDCGPVSRIVIEGRHYAGLHAEVHGTAAVTIVASSGPVSLGSATLRSDGPFTLTVTVPRGVRATRLKLSADRVCNPARAGISNDDRPLSVQISRVIIDEAAVLDFSRDAPWQVPSGVIGVQGLTLVAYVSDATGVAAGAQASLSACTAAGIPTELVDARAARPIRGRYPIALVHVNADQLPIVAGLLGETFFRDRHTIGVWAWELPVFPDEYLEAFRWVDEIWAGSRFIQAAAAEKATVPVLHMPYAVEAAPSPLRRADFDLPPDRVLFLTMYDALSVQDRKNPLGAVEAFQRAFGARLDVGLVVKVNHASSRPDDVAIVRERVAGAANMRLLDQPMTRADAQALQACCDVFVSLHRAEGFGLNIAEAMLLRKPVIVTAWSGNMDFTTHRNACLVDYRLVRLPVAKGPYRAGNEWAEPDLDDAGQWMQRLARDSALRSDLGRRGHETIATGFSPEAIGRMYERRLRFIEQHRRLSTPVSVQGAERGIPA